MFTRNLVKKFGSMIHLLPWRDRHRQTQKDEGIMPEQMRRRGKRGVWYADCRHTGTHIQDCLETTDRRRAERRLAELKISAERGEYLKLKVKFEKLVPEYKKRLLQKSKSLQIRNSIVIDKHLLPFLGDRNLGAIGRVTVIEYKQYREQQGITESTLKKELRVFRDIMLIADPGWKNPTSTDSVLMRFANKGKRVDRFLEEPDVHYISDFLPEKYRVLCLVAAYSGLRLKNVVELKWRNIDLVRGWINVKQSKTGNPVNVPICGKLGQIIESLKPRVVGKEIRVFPGVGAKAVSTAFRRASKKAGFGWASFHSLRHFCGSFLANNGVRREVIAEILGHHDIRSTKIYTHFRPQTIKKAVAVFDRMEQPEKDQKVSANLEF